MTEPYFDDSGPVAPGRSRFISPVRDITPAFDLSRPEVPAHRGQDVMASFVWFEPGPGGCHAVDVFSPLRQAMLPFTSPELFIDLEQDDG